MDDNKIKIRLKELGYRSDKVVTWTRKKALETINYVMDLNRADLERINDAYQTEIDLYELKLQQKGADLAKAGAEGDQRMVQQIAREMQDITNTVQKLRKQKRTNSTNIKGIFEGAKILNRMFGFDITKVEVKQVDEDREELNKLSADELRQILAQANKE